MLNTTHISGWINGFNVAQNQIDRSEITHLQHVDDILIFFDAEESQLKYLRLLYPFLSYLFRTANELEKELDLLS